MNIYSKFCLLFALGFIVSLTSGASAQVTARELSNIYESWRAAMVRKDARAWQSLTSQHRQIEVKNRILSAKAPFPRALFDTPTAPPSMRGLKMVRAQEKRGIAKITWFGKVNFGVGGDPTNNLYVASFLNEGGKWKYDGAEFVNLMALPDVRKQLEAGNNSFVAGADFQPSSKRPPVPKAVGKVKYIAKVYAFCPGRAVDVSINGMSHHRFQNDQQAQVVIGGAKDGKNSITLKTRTLEGGRGNEAFTVRVYLVNENDLKTPVKIYEYLVNEGGKIKSSLKGSFTITPERGRNLLRR